MLIERIYDWAHKTPERTALVWNDQPVSYARFARGIDGAHRFLRVHDLPVGSMAVVVIDNLLDCWTMILTLRSLGMNTVAVLNLDVAMTLGLKGVSCVLSDTIEGQLSTTAAQAWPGAVHIQVPRFFYRQIADGPPPTLDSARPIAGDHLIYTSGTTGRYKLIVQLARNELDQLEQAQSFGVRADEPWFVGNLRMWTAVGYWSPIAVWCLGGHVVFDQRQDWAQYFVRRPCGTMLVPDMVSALLAQDRQPNAPGHWVLWVSGGFITTGQALLIKQQLTTDLRIGYGSSEMRRSALYSRVDDVEQMHWLSVAPGRSVEIVDENDQLCGVGEEGQLRMRLESYDAQSYLDDETASRLVFRQGYLYPGDMAVQRSDGCIRVLGRNADVLNVKGNKMAVAPVEQAIQDLLGVSAVCIFNGIDEKGFEEVLVVCEGGQQPSASEFDLLRSQLSVFDHVRWIMQPVFPRTKSGVSKVDRWTLRQQIFGAVSKD
ncbi:class I adenylate-forming enzyme family protein [Limnohabitans sp. Jir72]|uniref:class I adenylate-forming enzyme family protein n=1 Tax=Limnohabitans sp. Jir72 TaxID=1977909 RepID=UPI000D3B3DC6|nr:AMP-binding protein [Limnohabitans sp. Jir72]PUE24590.1 hypothetical protein B9Z52_17025 [Limnohabitans sp. Jir72]